MPECHSIQTFVPVDDDTTQPRLESFRVLLERLCLLTPQTHLAIRSFDWRRITPEGFVYSSSTNSLPLQLGSRTVTCFPYVLGWGRPVSPRGERFLEFELNIHSSDLVGADYAYAPEICAPLYDLCREVGLLNPQGPAYLCTDGQDGRPWLWFVQREPDQQWCFDLAVVPRTMAGIYSPTPSSMMMHETADGLAFAARDVFADAPWG